MDPICYHVKPVKTTRLSLILADKIKRDLGVSVIPVIRRTYAGRNAKDSGGWLWTMARASSCGDVGSCSRASTLVKCKTKLVIDSNGEIYSD